MALSQVQKERYARHIILEEIGEAGQQKLFSSSVLIIGAGGLGSPCALYMAAAGIGTLGIADADKVELSNLQRQILHFTADKGRNKVTSAREKLSALNPDMQIDTYAYFVDNENIDGLVKKYDIVIDATDNYSSKFVINDACVRNEKPFIHAGISGLKGQLMTYVPHKGPCLRCIFGVQPPDRPKGVYEGVVGAAAGVIGCLEAMEAIKYILGRGELLTGCMLTFDALTMQFRKIRLPSDKDCPVCGAHSEGDVHND